MPTDSLQPSRVRAGDELRQAALEQFAIAGFSATSLQQIADHAGYSKSSVLYHYASKEAVLEAAVTPTVERLETLVTGFAAGRQSAAALDAFIADFVDLLLSEPLAVHLFVSQGGALRGIPVIERGNAVIRTLADAICTGANLTEQIRFGVALAGATYALVAGATFFEGDEPAEMLFSHSEEATRAALIEVLTELLNPATGR